MLDIIKFVGAAVCKNGFNPYHMHFLLHGGRLTASNGNVTISAPFPVDLSCAPHAESFTKAIQACEGPVTLTLESARLVVRSGKFRSVVPCMDVEKWPLVPISGECLPLQGDLISALKKLLPFVSTDEQRPWACGVMLSGNSAFATNSITLVEHHLPVAFPVVANIPIEAVRELVRIKTQPQSVQVEPHQLTFHLPDESYITCKMINHQWPDMNRIFSASAEYEGIFVEGSELETTIEDVKKLNNFTDNGLIYFHPGRLSTARIDEPGTDIENLNTPHLGAFRSSQITALSGVANKVGFAAYPKAVPFYGDNLRGVMTCFRI